jgi:hypothetical protein
LVLLAGHQGQWIYWSRRFEVGRKRVEHSLSTADQPGLVGDQLGFLLQQLRQPTTAQVVMLAQEEARRLGHNFVGTEQLLLGLIGESTGIAAKVLKSMGVNLKDARVEVEKIIGRGSGFVAVEIPFTPRAKRVLEMSLEEARQLGESFLLAARFVFEWLVGLRVAS